MDAAASTGSYSVSYGYVDEVDVASPCEVDAVAVGDAGAVDSGVVDGWDATLVAV